MPAITSQSPAESRASYNIERMVCGFPARLRQNRCIVVLDGFVDDSGLGHGKVAVLAGFLSIAERWKKFSDALESLCEREPKTPDFKMHKAHGFRAYPWASREQLDKRIEEVGSLIREYAMYRVDVVLQRLAYMDIVKGKVPRKIDSPYFMLFYVVLLATAEFMDKSGLEGTVDFVFDEQDKIGRLCASFYYDLKRWVPDRIRKRLGGEPTFRHDKDLLPLKAADYLAWHIRRHLDIEQTEAKPHNEIVDSVLAMYGVSCQTRAEDLRALVRNIAHGAMFRGKCSYLLPPARPTANPAVSIE
jgi:hypothetical protein